MSHARRHPVPRAGSRLTWLAVAAWLAMAGATVTTAAESGTERSQIFAGRGGQRSLERWPELQEPGEIPLRLVSARRQDAVEQPAFSTPGTPREQLEGTAPSEPHVCPECGAGAGELDAPGCGTGPLRRGLAKLFHSGATADPARHESWLFRPFSVTWFVGGLWGSEMVYDWVAGDRGILGGVRVGYDLDHYWGTEVRFAFGSVGLVDSRRAIEAAVFPVTNPLYYYGATHREATMFLCDINVLFYPWGDNPWRPYVLVGLGSSFLSFTDRLATPYSVNQLELPIGIGLKYRIAHSLALRLECTDNLALSNSGVQTLHQFSLVGAAEFRFGGSRKTYWPWNPGRSVW
jgi:hypothetical protein